MISGLISGLYKDNSNEFSKYLGAALQGLLSSETVGVHVYGNSLGSAGTFAYTLCASSGGRLCVLANSAVGGYTSALTLSKLQAEGLAPNSKILLYIEGTNDAGQGVTPFQHRDNMLAIAQYAIDRCVVPVMCVTPPRSTTFVNEANSIAIIDSLIGLKYNIPVFDIFARWVDYTTGKWLSSAGGDGIHPSQSTYGTAGVDLWNSIYNKIPCYVLPRTNGGNGLWLWNVLNQSDTDANNLPDDWQVISLTGQTYPVRQDYTPPFIGKRARLTVSQATSGGTLYRVLGKTGKFADGDELVVSGVLGVDTITNARIVVFIRAQSAGVPDIFLGGFTSATPDTYLQAKFIVPAGTTDLRLFIKFEADVAGTHGGTIGYGCWDFYNLTTQV